MKDIIIILIIIFIFTLCIFSLRFKFNKETTITEGMVGMVDDKRWNAFYTTVLLKGSTVIDHNIVNNLKDLNKISNTTNEYYYPELDYIFKSTNDNNESIISKVKQYLENNKPSQITITSTAVFCYPLTVDFSNVNTNTNNTNASILTLVEKTAYDSKLKDLFNNNFKQFSSYAGKNGMNYQSIKISNFKNNFKNNEYTISCWFYFPKDIGDWDVHAYWLMI